MRHDMNTAKPVHGFSLIEVLIVMAVIGILAAITLPNMSGNRAAGRDTARIADIERIMLALDLYHAQCRQYPLSLTAGEDNGGVCTKTIDTFLNLPVLDPQGVDYNDGYAVDGTASDYVVGILLERDNAVLQDDIDTADVFGLGTLDCSPALMYCTGP